MEDLLEELYKARQDFYYKICIIQSIVEKADIKQSQLDLIASIVRDAEIEYLEASDRYYDSLSCKEEKERGTPCIII